MASYDIVESREQHGHRSNGKGVRVAKTRASAAPTGVSEVVALFGRRAYW